MAYPFLVVGLGNPGKKYSQTRHNIGYRIVSSFASQTHTLLKKQKCESLLGVARIDGYDREIIMAHPQTFMNRSGIAVRGLVNYYKITASDILVCCDDLDLPLGKIRIKKSGGSGGHKGLISIMEELKTEEFLRLRIGIGKPLNKEDIENYVLNNFRGGEKKLIKEAIEKASLAIQDILIKGLFFAMNKYNG